MPHHKHLHQQRQHAHNHNLIAISRPHNDHSDGALQRRLRRKRRKRRKQHATHKRDVGAVSRLHKGGVNAICCSHLDVDATRRPHNGGSDGIVQHLRRKPRKRHEHGRGRGAEFENCERGGADFDGCHGRGGVSWWGAGFCACEGCFGGCCWVVCGGVISWILGLIIGSMSKRTYMNSVVIMIVILMRG